MTQTETATGPKIPFEEEYLGYLISINENPDNYNEGYLWDVSKDGNIIDSGFEFSTELALKSAQRTVEELNSEEESNLVSSPSQ